MVIFPNAKINIGLNILRKRVDGYHEIETLFYPIGLKDALEYVENGKDRVNFYGSGLELAIEPEQNIVLKSLPDAAGRAFASRVWTFTCTK